MFYSTFPAENRSLEAVSLERALMLERREQLEPVKIITFEIPDHDG
jgi:hypothetical protein